MNSQIILCRNINVDKQYTNVLNYSESQMLALCRANAIASADNYSFLRPTGTIFCRVYLCTMYSSELHCFPKSRLFKQMVFCLD